MVTCAADALRRPGTAAVVPVAAALCRAGGRPGHRGGCGRAALCCALRQLRHRAHAGAEPTLTLLEPLLYLRTLHVLSWRCRPVVCWRATRGPQRPLTRRLLLRSQPILALGPCRRRRHPRHYINISSISDGPLVPSMTLSHASVIPAQVIMELLP